MLLTPFKFDTLSEAIEEAHRFEERTDFPCRVTEEQLLPSFNHAKIIGDRKKKVRNKLETIY